MTTPHFLGAWKIAIWAGGSLVVMATALVADMQQGMSPLVEVALITSISSLLVAIITGAVSIYLQRRTGQKVDGILSKSLADQQSASTRADTAEGFTKGSDAERAKVKNSEPVKD
jgi:hypothetical protein